MSQRRYHIVLNANSGTVLAQGLTGPALLDLFARHGLEATVDDDTDAPLPERIEKALDTGADTIVAAGGDGTVTAIAAAIIGRGRTLAILPLGTANLLARDLGVPLDPEQCVAALPDMEPFEIDVSEVNGVVFLHKVVIGVIPELAAGREMIRGQGPAARIGYMRYFFRRVGRARRLALEITTGEGERRIERVQALAVASNGYDEGPGRFFHRERLDTGLLTIYTLRHLGFSDMLRLATRMLAGRWRDDAVLAIATARSVTIRSRKPLLHLMIDGEVAAMEVPLEFTIHPRALSVLAPPGAAVVGAAGERRA